MRSKFARLRCWAMKFSMKRLTAAIQELAALRVENYPASASASASERAAPGAPARRQCRRWHQ